MNLKFVQISLWVGWGDLKTVLNSEIWNRSHTYSNSYVLLNFRTNKSFTIQELLRFTIQELLRRWNQLHLTHRWRWAMDTHKHTHNTHTLAPKHQQILPSSFKGTFELAYVICQSFYHYRTASRWVQRILSATCAVYGQISRAPSSSIYVLAVSQKVELQRFQAGLDRQVIFKNTVRHMCVCTCSFVHVGHPISYGILMYVFDLSTLEPWAGVQGFAGKKHERVARKWPFVEDRQHSVFSLYNEMSVM